MSEYSAIENTTRKARKKTTKRQGAARATDTETTPMADLDELPLVVWLRGDEDYVEEFSLEADDVMRQLGIRRSRLTQISGKELRVARIRAGRYIKPLYRPEDVDAYLAWTRPTRSHSKATNLVKDAAQDLTAVAKDLAGRYQKARSELAQDVSGKLAGLLKSRDTVHFRHAFQIASQLQFRLERLEKKGSEQSMGFAASLSTLAAGVKEVETKLRHPDFWDGIKATLAGLSNGLSRQGQQLQDLQERMTAMEDKLTADNTQVYDALAEMKTGFEAWRKSLLREKPRTRPQKWFGKIPDQATERDFELRPRRRPRKSRF